MLIQKNGFYDLSSLEENEIIITSGVVASFFDSGKNNKKIFLKKDTFVNFYSFIEKEKVLSIEFFQEEENSKLEIKYLLFSRDLENINSKISAEILADNCKTNVKILSIVGENGKIFVDGVIKINKDLKNLDCHLFEENIFLGKLGQIEAKPKLLVESNDVKASHSCKVERINNNKIFYLKSRGINENEAIKLLLEANIKSLFSGLDYEKLLDYIYLKLI